MTTTTPLTDVPAGKAALVVGVTGGHALVSRLASLGLTPGTLVVPVRNAGPGPVIVLVRDTRLALGRSEATSVLVMAPPSTEEGVDGH